MVFSENQVRHLYVAGAVQDSTLSAKKDIVVKKVKDILTFSYKGAADVMRSDAIDVNTITSVKVTPAAKMQMKLKATKIALDSNVNGGAVIAGQDYILKIAIRQAFGTSDQDIYFKYGMVHGKTSMVTNPTEFYLTLLESLNKNFSRENTTWFVFKGIKKSDHSLVDNPTATAFDGTSDAKTLEGIAICEVEQEWKLGVKPLVPVYFDVMCDNIMVSGDETVWGTVSDVTSTYNQTVNNGKITADLEYFCMGERGDIYRNVGFPHVINTEYQANSATAYDYIDIEYHYAGPSEDVQKSKKVITIVADASSHTVMDNLIVKLSTALPGVFKVWNGSNAYQDVTSNKKYFANEDNSHPSYTTIG